MIHPNFRARFFGLVCAAAVCAGAATFNACGEFTGVPASLPTLADSGTVYALNGAPAGAPSALHVFTGSLTAPDAGFLFDVAFDIDSAGNVVVYPQRAVASGLAVTHTVGLQKDSVDSFDALTRAPANGYRVDTAMTVKPNQLILVQSADPTACTVSITGTTIYAKIQIESLFVAKRQLKVRFVTDPNCGFRSFASGVPKD